MAWFKCAEHEPISCNTGGVLDPIGAVLHQAQGYGSLFYWFNNPAAGVSAHFWVAKNGKIEQYVDSARVAWHGVNLNSQYVGVETEGYDTEPLTLDQIDAFGRIMAEGKAVHGWPLVEANVAGESGLGYHRMPGSGTNTECPSDLRLSARPQILAAAGGAPPEPPQPPEEDDCPMVIATNNAGGQWLIWGSFRTAIANPAESDRYQRAGAKKVDWTEEMIQKFPIAKNAVK